MQHWLAASFWFRLCLIQQKPAVSSHTHTANHKLECSSRTEQGWAGWGKLLYAILGDGEPGDLEPGELQISLRQHFGDSTNYPLLHTTQGFQICQKCERATQTDKFLIAAVRYRYFITLPSCNTAHLEQRLLRNIAKARVQNIVSCGSLKWTRQIFTGCERWRGGKGIWKEKQTERWRKEDGEPTEVQVQFCGWASCKVARKLEEWFSFPPRIMVCVCGKGSKVPLQGGHKT